MPNIKITYDKELDTRIPKEERDSLKRLFVANAKEVVKSDRSLNIIDGPTQTIPAPNDVVVDNSTNGDATTPEFGGGGSGNESSQPESTSTRKRNNK